MYKFNICIDYTIYKYNTIYTPVYLEVELDLNENTLLKLKLKSKELFTL